MKNKLINEINRYNQLMGTSVLLESTSSSVIDEIINIITKLVSKQPDNIKTLIRNLENAISEEDAFKILSQIVNESDDLASVIIPKILDSVSNIERKQIVDLKNLLKQQFESGVDIISLKQIGSSWIKKNVVTKFDSIQNIFIKEVDDYLNSLRKTNVSPSPNPKKPKIRDIAGKQWNDIEPLTSDEILELEKLYRSKGLLGSFFKSMRIFTKNVNDMIIGEAKLLDETLSMIKTLDNLPNSSDRVYILEGIGENVKKLTQMQSDNKKIIDEWLNVNVLDYKLREAIKSQDGYKSAAGIMDDSSLTSWKQNYKGLSERRGMLRTQLNSVFNPFSWSSKNLEKHGGAWKKWKKIFSDAEFGELRRWLLTGQTQKWSGMKDYANKFGLPKTLANATKEQLYSYLMLTTAYAFADYITDWLGSRLIEYSWFEDNSWVRKQASGYYENVGIYKQEDTVSQGSKIGAKVIWNYMINEFNDFTISFPGLTDDMVKYFGWMNSEDPSTKEDVEEIIRKFNDAKEKIKNEKEKIEGELNGGNVAPGGGNVAPGGETNGGGNVAPGGERNPINNDTLNYGIPQ
jgi:hypothetical protein